MNIEQNILPQEPTEEKEEDVYMEEDLHNIVNNNFTEEESKILNPAMQEQLQGFYNTLKKNEGNINKDILIINWIKKKLNSNGLTTNSSEHNTGELPELDEDILKFIKNVIKFIHDNDKNSEYKKEYLDEDINRFLPEYIKPHQNALENNENAPEIITRLIKRIQKNLDFLNRTSTNY